VAEELRYAAAGPSHAVSIAAVVMMYGLFLIGLTHKVLTRFVVAWGFIVGDHQCAVSSTC
jgi:hypothetical protein